MFNNNSAQLLEQSEKDKRGGQGSGHGYQTRQSSGNSGNIFQTGQGNTGQGNSGGSGNTGNIFQTGQTNTNSGGSGNIFQTNSGGSGSAETSSRPTRATPRKAATCSKVDHQATTCPKPDKAQQGKDRDKATRTTRRHNT